MCLCGMQVVVAELKATTILASDLSAGQGKLAFPECLLLPSCSDSLRPPRCRASSQLKTTCALLPLSVSEPLVLVGPDSHICSVPPFTCTYQIWFCSLASMSHFYLIIRKTRTLRVEESFFLPRAIFFSCPTVWESCWLYLQHQSRVPGPLH